MMLRGICAPQRLLVSSLHFPTAIVFLLISSEAMTSENESKCKPEVLILLDRSGSMMGDLSAHTEDAPKKKAQKGESKWDYARKAINIVTGKYQDNINFGLMLFSSPHSNGCYVSSNPQVPFHEDASSQKRISSVLNKVKAGAHTPMHHALQQAGRYLSLRALNDEHRANRRRIVLLITDGDANCGNCCNCKTSKGGNPKDKSYPLSVISLMNAQGIETIVVGFGEGINESKFKQMGEANPPLINSVPERSYTQADNSDELETALKDIAESIATTEPCDGKDNDCDGKIDESHDKDGDTYTTCGLGRTNGKPGAKDCNDGVSSIYPGAIEKCDNLDNNCNGAIDDIPQEIPSPKGNKDPKDEEPPKDVKVCIEGKEIDYTQKAEAIEKETVISSVYKFPTYFYNFNANIFVGVSVIDSGEISLNIKDPEADVFGNRLKIKLKDETSDRFAVDLSVMGMVDWAKAHFLPGGDYSLTKSTTHLGQLHAWFERKNLRASSLVEVDSTTVLPDNVIPQYRVSTSYRQVSYMGGLTYYWKEGGDNQQALIDKMKDKAKRQRFQFTETLKDELFLRLSAAYRHQEQSISVQAAAVEPPEAPQFPESLYRTYGSSHKGMWGDLWVRGAWPIDEGYSLGLDAQLPFHAGRRNLPGSPYEYGLHPDARMTLFLSDFWDDCSLQIQAGASFLTQKIAKIGDVEDSLNFTGGSVGASMFIPTKPANITIQLRFQGERQIDRNGGSRIEGAVYAQYGPFAITFNIRNEDYKWNTEHTNVRTISIGVRYSPISGDGLNLSELMSSFLEIY